jgi:hypothetical protein
VFPHLEAWRTVREYRRMNWRYSKDRERLKNHARNKIVLLISRFDKARNIPMVDHQFDTLSGVKKTGSAPSRKNQTCLVSSDGLATEGGRRTGFPPLRYGCQCQLRAKNKNY